MTCIAWDGKTLAADKAATNVGYMRRVTKIFRVPEGLVGFAGDGDYALEFLEWFNNGRVVADYPKSLADGAVGAIFIDQDKRCWGYTKVPYPQLCEDAFDALGSGRDYALAAMYLGKTAKEAVEVAIALDNGCGKGIDVLEIKND